MAWHCQYDTDMRAVIAAVAILAVVLLPGSVRAATAWPVDDTCTTSHSGSYFYLGGPLNGFGIHSGGYNNCHLTNSTTTGGNPVHWAHYLLPVNNPNYAGIYAISSWVNCEHNAPKYKYDLYFNGTGGGTPNEIYTTGSHVTCGEHSNGSRIDRTGHRVPRFGSSITSGSGPSRSSSTGSSSIHDAQ